MTGLFDSLVGTPVERQRAVLRKALEARRDAWADSHPGKWVYEGGGDLLLRHGTFYSGRELPEKYAHLRGAPSCCFDNALKAVRADPTLTYVEGVYAIGSTHYTPHAWCLDPQGQLLEMTLPTDEATRARALERRGMPILPLEHWGYWGVVLHPDYVEAVWAAQEGQGVLDRPVQDALEGNPHAMEWRDDWLILHHTYDPERTKP